MKHIGTKPEVCMHKECHEKISTLTEVIIHVAKYHCKELFCDKDMKYHDGINTQEEDKRWEKKTEKYNKIVYSKTTLDKVTHSTVLEWMERPLKVS